MEIAQILGFSYVDNCNMIQLDDDVEATDLQLQLEISE